MNPLVVKLTGIGAAAVILSAVMISCNLQTPEPYGAAMARSQGQFDGKEVEVSSASGAASCGPSTPQIDTRLQAGQVYEKTYKSLNGQKSKVVAVRARILTVSATRLEERVLPVTVSGINGVSMTTEEPLVCSYDSGGKGSCTEPSFVNAVSMNGSGDFRDCELTGTGSDAVEKKAWSGTYTLQNGQNISATKIVTRSKGELVCDSWQISTGERLETMITTANVAAEGELSNCGGTVLFHATVYKNNQGRVMMGESEERTVVP